MRWQRRIALSVLTCLLLGSVACGGGQPPPPSQEPTAGFTIPPPSTQGYVPPIPELRTVTLAVENWGGGSEITEIVLPEINRLLEEEGTTLRLDMVRVDTSRGELLPFKMANGSVAADLFVARLAPDRYDGLYYLADGGAMADIGEYLPQYPDLYSLNPEDVWREVTIDGSIYCFPLTSWDVTGIFSSRPRVMVGSEWMEELEAKFPETIEELKSLLYRARDNNMPYKILASSSAPPYAFHRTYEQWPFYVDEKSRFVFYPDGSVEPYIDSEIFLQDAALIQELQDLDLLVVNSEAGEYSISQYDGDRSVIAMALYPNYVGSGSMGLERLAPEKPVFRTQSAAYYAFYVPSSCENVGDALEMLQYLYCHPEISLVFTYGIEGQDWVRQADGSIERIVIRDQQYTYLHSLSRFDTTSSRWQEAQATPTVDLPAAGFMLSFDYNRPGVRLSELYALRRGTLSMAELDGVRERLDEQGFYELVETCKMKYAEYLE